MLLDRRVWVGFSDLRVFNCLVYGLGLRVRFLFKDLRTVQG